MELLHREEDLVVGDNELYSVTDASDYTIPVHGEQRDGGGRLGVATRKKG
jgi:predicted N-formylglutamate amidohydrolase